jgi:hypothetical protein
MVPGVAAAPSPPPATGADAYRHLVTYADFGVHRTGTAVDTRTSRWIGRELRALGYRVERQLFTFPAFRARAVSLAVGDARPEVMPFYYSGATGRVGITAPLVDVGFGTPAEFRAADVEGGIALVQVPHPAPGAHQSLEPALGQARANGAVGVVAALGAPANELFGVNADARTGLCDLPVVVVGRDDGAALRSRAGQDARLVLDAAVEPGTTANVVGVLPGRSGRTVIVGTPMNGWFRAATERGTGVGTFLTLARHFAATPPEHTLVFVATAGHEVGFLGLERFLADNPDLVEPAVAYVHLGASLAARHQTEVAGQIHSTGRADPLRVLITSENPLLQALTQAAFAPAQPIVSVPPAAGQSGEQQFAYEAGIPIVSISGTFLWFHTARDLPDTTDATLLDPVVQGFRTVIEQLLAADPALVEQANAPARLVHDATAAGLGNTVAAC